MELKSVDLFLLDMDGTIYLGDSLIHGAKDFLKAIGDKGKRRVFLTNNSSKSKSAYVDKLLRLGIDASEKDIFTSGDATINYIKKQKAGNKVYLMGTCDLEKSFYEGGLDLIKGGKQEVDYVVLGFDTAITYEKMWTAFNYIRVGAQFIVTHGDLTCPIEGGSMPDAGAMAKMFESAAGVKGVYMGKPNLPIVETIKEALDLDLSRTAMVGDRLYTDVAMGAVCKMKSVLVLSGETSREEYEGQKEFRADFVYKSVFEMIKDL